MATDADLISCIVERKYNQIGTSGKPMANQWSHFAAILAKFGATEDRVEVLSVATGTKCLGESHVSDRGLSINDSHAEVLVRRAVMRFPHSPNFRYFLQEIQQLTTKSSSGDEETSNIIETTGDGYFRVKDGVKFILYTSQTPCGDASIIPRSNEDIHRTGAKCLSADNGDPKLPGLNYHTVGAFRTKPGRGIATLSMSCSDKILKWSVMGFQGSLLSLLMPDPVYFEEIVVGNCPYDELVMRRALVERNSIGLDAVLNGKYRVRSPKFLHSSREWKVSRKRSSDTTASTEALVWYSGASVPEIYVNGYKRGYSKATRSLPRLRSPLCRAAIADDVAQLIKLSSLTYIQLKDKCSEYRTTWDLVKDHYKDWVSRERKCKFQQFLVLATDDDDDSVVVDCKADPNR